MPVSHAREGKRADLWNEPHPVRSAKLATAVTKIMAWLGCERLVACFNAFLTIAVIHMWAHKLIVG